MIDIDIDRELALSIEETSRSESSSTWHHSEHDPCDEINSLLKSCLDSSQTEGIPNSSRCYWAPTPEEAVACWCRVCDFQRAVEICSVPRTYQTCDACQGRSLQDWTQSRCSVGDFFSKKEEKEEDAERQTQNVDTENNSLGWGEGVYILNKLSLSFSLLTQRLSRRQRPCCCVQSYGMLQRSSEIPCLCRAFWTTLYVVCMYACILSLYKT